jgi:hypothetical protein
MKVMQKRKCLVGLLAMLFAAMSLNAQSKPTPPVSSLRRFPDWGNFQTLLCDFHQHTVFSDGEVLPSIRVREAQQDGLDAISLTEHVEAQKFGTDIPNPDHNRSYYMGSDAAAGSRLFVINGAEITRGMPPGHVNALYVTDANALTVQDSLEAIRIAFEQGAFLFWNHPMWVAQAPDGIPPHSPLHEQLIAKGHLKGIEVVNDWSYSEEAFQIALDKGLTIFGNSDIHGLISQEYPIVNGEHRPMTLVFARSRTLSGIKQALEEDRTAIWFKDFLIGKEKNLLPLLQASLQVTDVYTEANSSVSYVTLQNRSATKIILENASPWSFMSGPGLVEIPAYESRMVIVNLPKKVAEFQLKMVVQNAFIGPRQHPSIVLNVSLP